MPDIVETCLDVGGASRPTTKNGKSVPASDGVSLVDTLAGSGKPIHDKPIFIEHEGNRIARDGRWKLVSFYDKPWELYDMESDRSESEDLARARPEIVDRLEKAYGQWAERASVVPWKTAVEFNVYQVLRNKQAAAN